MDLAQWVDFASYHEERHLGQIRALSISLAMNNLRPHIASTIMEQPKNLQSYHLGWRFSMFHIVLVQLDMLMLI
jgi:hypothetical protein